MMELIPCTSCAVMTFPFTLKVLRLELKALHMLDKHSTTERRPQTFFKIFEMGSM